MLVTEMKIGETKDLPALGIRLKLIKTSAGKAKVGAWKIDPPPKNLLDKQGIVPQE